MAAFEDEHDSYYRHRPKDRDDILANPEVVFQLFAFEKANLRAFRRLALERDSARILDVGCGSGPDLLAFLRWRFPASNLAGIDLDSARVAVARARVPHADIREGDASRMPFADSSFDVVFESGMFILMADESLARAIGREMIRVVRPGGHLIIADWRYGKPGNRDLVAVSAARIARLFDVGGETIVIARERGALVPPVGRWISRTIPGLYFVLQSLFPFLVGQMTTVLRKKE